MASQITRNSIVCSSVFTHTTKKTPKLHVTGFCEENPPETVGFCSQRFTNAKSVSLLCVGELGQHWFRQWPVACLAPSHYLNQCWIIVNLTIRNFSEILIEIQTFSFKKMHLKMSSAIFPPNCPGEMSYKLMSLLKWNYLVRDTLVFLIFPSRMTVSYQLRLG